MNKLEYHLGCESRNSKNYLTLDLNQKWTLEALKNHSDASLEGEALQLLLKVHLKLFPGVRDVNRFFFPADESFSLLKLLGATGRLFYQKKKVVIDPFSFLDLHIELEKLTSDKANLFSQVRLRTQVFLLSSCEWVFPADPSWVLQSGVIRSFKDTISSTWVRWASQAGSILEGKALFSFLDKAEGDLSFSWKEGLSFSALEPHPCLVLADRHGGFADLWFDYGSLGKVPSHDSSNDSFRNEVSEKGYEKDLLETDFIKKQVEQSHYYCPLDKVAKSLTFLLEIGWSILDARGRKVVRQGSADFSASIDAEAVLIQAKVHYAEHQLDLHNLIGAFNRREQFVDLSAHAVALIDRETLTRDWGDLLEEELVSDGIRLKKNRVGLLGSLLDQSACSIQEDLRSKLTALLHCQPICPALPSEKFQGRLFSYQQKGLEWLQFLHQGHLSGLLADEMGLGKTVQVLAFFSQLILTSPLLIVVPTSLLFNWQREFEKFLPALSVYRHEGRDRLTQIEDLQKRQVILTSYALLRIDAPLFQSFEFQCVILDEAQVIKNPDSQIATLCSSIKAQMRIAITGTPVENRLEDMWSIFRFLQPDLLGERKKFQADVLASQASPLYLERIRKKLRPFILRRKKEDVSLQLPLKLEQTIFVDMTEPQRAIYDDWLRKTKQGLLKKVSLEGASAHRMEILEAILRLRQLCAHPGLVDKENTESGAKFERLMADLEEIVQEGRKALVYSQFTSMLRLIEVALKERSWNYVYLDGSTKNREEVVGRFQEDKSVSIFLISLKAGGVGLNLTAADTVVLYDPWWNEAVERQAIDRAHRVGQHSTVIARRYITALSIEEKMLRLKAHKTALGEAVLDTNESASTTSLEELLTLLV